MLTSFPTILRHWWNCPMKITFVTGMTIPLWHFVKVISHFRFKLFACKKFWWKDQVHWLHIFYFFLFNSIIDLRSQTCNTCTKWEPKGTSEYSWQLGFGDLNKRYEVLMLKLSFTNQSNTTEFYQSNGVSSFTKSLKFSFVLVCDFFYLFIILC